MKIDAENLAVILAALRYWQHDLTTLPGAALRPEIAAIATDYNKFPLPDAEYIDTLCEALNFGDFDGDDTRQTLAIANFIEASWGETFDNESEMNGGDVVEWMGELIPMARKLLSGPKPTLAIICDGGLVQDVVSDQPEAFAGVNVLVIDYDDEGADLDRISVVPQSDGTNSTACVHGEVVEQATIDFAAIRDATEGDVS